VSKTTSILIKAFTGKKIPEPLFDNRLYFTYKKTGGFNNDWSHTYAYTMKALAELPPETLKKIQQIARESQKIINLAQRLNYIKQNQPKKGTNPKVLYKALLEFANELDSTGIESVDKRLLEIVGTDIKNALNYRAPVGESIVSTLFEEIFGGKILFEETFGIPAQFTKKEKGFVENEKTIIKPETLESLKNLIGGNRFGIASGSIANTARYALGDLLDSFSTESQIWHDNVEQAIKETGRTDLHKPNPYPLLKASKSYKPYKVVIYVGDTLADRLMARRTKELNPRFLFAGVYGALSLPEEGMKSFLEEEADIVAPSVNELPAILEALKKE
jgi:hypothetical protein